jgi:Zn-dependent protease with chaperone function
MPAKTCRSENDNPRKVSAMQKHGQIQEWDRRDLEGRWLALYGVTVALEVPAMLARYVAGLLVAGVVLRAGGSGGSAAEWAKLAAVGPIVWSALAFLTPRGGGWWWQQRVGGRAPSEREQAIYNSAMRQLLARTPVPLPTPESWFVRDDPRCEAAVYGNTLMLSRGALELDGSHLAALLAHQLGHMRGIDARLTVAVNRLVLKPLKTIARAPAPADPHESIELGRHPTHGEGTGAREHGAPHPGGSSHTPMGLTRWTLSRATALMRGGVGLQLTAPAWGAVWRAQEYEADRFAANIGWAAELAEFLETHVQEQDHPVPLVSLSRHTHPPTELRIDKLRQSARTQPTPAAETDPAWIGQPDASMKSRASRRVA